MPKCKPASHRASCTARRPSAEKVDYPTYESKAKHKKEKKKKDKRDEYTAVRDQSDSSDDDVPSSQHLAEMPARRRRHCWGGTGRAVHISDIHSV